jgi:hypothetical protein
MFDPGFRERPRVRGRIPLTPASSTQTQQLCRFFLGHNIDLLLGDPFGHQFQDEGFVYNIVKAVMEHPEDLATGPKALKNVLLKNAQYIMLPLHKGAYKFYTEKGVKLPQAAMPID